MKNLTCISGSASPDSSNVRLLRTISEAFDEHYAFRVMDGLWDLPLYSPQREESGIPENVEQLRNAVSGADAIVISTPEYLHNIPAVLKNALEWMTHSGNLADKPVLPITFSPHAPRGEHAMDSLLRSLKASKARIVTQLPLYRDELTGPNGGIVLPNEQRLLMEEALKLL